MHRKPDGHRAERYRHVALPAVRIERDAVGVAHRAFAREAGGLVHPAPRQDVPSGEPYDEIPAVADEIAVERGPVAAPVVHRDAFPAGGRVDGLEDLQDLVVLALEPGRARGPQPQRERDGLPAADAARRDHAAVVAVDEHVASHKNGFFIRFIGTQPVKTRF